MQSCKLWPKQNYMKRRVSSSLYQYFTIYYKQFHINRKGKFFSNILWSEATICNIKYDYQVIFELKKTKSWNLLVTCRACLDILSRIHIVRLGTSIFSEKNLMDITKPKDGTSDIEIKTVGSFV